MFVCEPKNKQYYGIIENSLEEMQELVGGYLEKVNIPYLAQKNIWLMVDEEGALKGKEQCLWVDTTWIVGKCFFVKQLNDVFVTLGQKDKEMIEKYMSGDPTTSSIHMVLKN